MARFYKTSVPEFVEDFIYQPPWELAQEVMKTNEEGIQNTLGAASLLQNIDINYIPDPVEKAKVEELQKKYGDAASSLATNLQIGLQNNPQAWRKTLPELSNLSSELNKDIKSGEIAKITQSYNNYTKWLEDNKDIKEKDPLLYGAAQNALMREWQKNPNRSQDAVWQGVDLVDFDIHSKDIMEGLKNFEADIQTQIANGYIAQDKFLTKDKVIQAYMDRVLTDPKARAYLQQAVAFGVPGFVDEEGNPLSIMIPVNTKTGETLSSEEYQKEIERYNSMTPKERAEKGLSEDTYSVVLNPKHTWAQAFEGYGSQRSFSQTTVKTDTTYNAAMNRAWQKEKFYVEMAFKEKGLDLKKEAEKTKEQKEIRNEIGKQRDIVAAYGPTSSKGKLALATINRLEKESLNLNQSSDITDLEPFTAAFFPNLSLEEIHKKLLNSNKEKPTLQSQSLRAYDKGISESVIKDMNISKPEQLDLINYVSNNTDGSKRSINELASKWLKNHGYEPKRDITVAESITTRVSGKFIPKVLPTTQLNQEEDSYSSMLSLVNKYFENKEAKIQKMNTEQPKLTGYRLTDAGKNILKNEFISNSSAYSVIPLDMVDNGKVPKDVNPKVLAENGDIEAVAPKTIYNQGTIIKYKDRQYLLVNNGTVEDANNRNYSLYSKTGMYLNKEEEDKMKIRGRNSMAQAATSIISSLNTEEGTALIDKDNNPYYQTEYPLAGASALQIRYYLNDSSYRLYVSGETEPSYIIKREEGETPESYFQRQLPEMEWAIEKSLEYSEKEFETAADRAFSNIKNSRR